jgi:hypothetical protein
MEWRWVDVNGEQHVVSFDELTRALSEGTLPPVTLVWRRGWTEWLHAANVPELTFAIGVGRSGAPSLVRSSPSSTVPPPPPLERYGADGPGASGPQRGAGAEHRRAPPSVIPKPRLPSPRPAAPVRIRDVMPTLADVEEPQRSTTLRPAGALPPPPRTFPMPARLPDISVDGGEGPESVEPAAALEPPRAPSSPPPLPPRTPARAPEPTTSAPTAAAVPPAKARGLTRDTVTVATSIGLLLPGTILLTLAIVTRKPKPSSHVLPAVASVVIRPSAVGCALETPARRLSPEAFVGVPLLLASAPSGGPALGFAASKDRAVGLTIDVATLTPAPAFEQAAEGRALLGVVPLSRSGRLEFATDRADGPLASARTVDAPTPFSIGVDGEGFSRAIGDKLDVIWPGRSKNPTITTPRVASIAGFGHAIAFRHGGQEGKVLVGWLDENGAKKSELKAVETDSTLVGTPAVAANDKAVLVAFAGKTSADAPFRVELATMAHGALPSAARVFAVPPGGPGGEAISPSAEGLPDGRFLVQWTEGAAGNRAVRAIVVSSDLVPEGEPVTLSTPDQNAGQGALWVQKGRALALFLVKAESTHELWGASLRCP